MSSPEFRKPPGIRPFHPDVEKSPDNFIEAKVKSGGVEQLRYAFEQGETIRWSYSREKFLLELWHWRDGEHQDMHRDHFDWIPGYVSLKNGLAFKDVRETTDQEKEYIEQAIAELLLKK